MNLDKSTAKKLQAIGIPKYMQGFWFRLEDLNCTQINHVKKMINLLESERKRNAEKK